MRLVALATFALALTAHATGARADVFGYVDGTGELHLATEKLDDRYHLFMKAREGGPVNPLAPAQPAPAPTIDPKLMKVKLFKRLVDHPNIAKYGPLIRSTSSERGLDPELVKAVIAVESGFDAGAVSDKGAIGLMQVLPATGQRYGVAADKRRSVEQKLKDPKLNLRIGTHYLADLMTMFPDRVDLALAAYNAGEQAVIDHRNAIPPYRETQAYVKLVDQFHTFYSPRPTPEVPAVVPRAGSRVRVMIPPPVAAGTPAAATDSPAIGADPGPVPAGPATSDSPSP
jgi:soluble lytic murein transglycosylase-like protein